MVETTEQTPNRQNAAATPGAFHAARLAWLDARQTLEKAGAVSDQKAARLLKARRDAAWQMVRAPVRGLEDIRELAAGVQEIFTEVDEAGAPTDNVHRALLDRLLREVVQYEGGDAS